jgi:type VI secretion system protein ImpL
LPDGSPGPIAPAEADRFSALANLTLPDTNGSSPLSGILQSFKDLQALRTPGGAGRAAAGAADRLSRILADAKREPEPVRSMLLSLAAIPDDFGPVQQTRMSAPALSRQIAAKLGVPCIQLVAGHFPFDRRAVRDATFDDFAQLFAPKGAFDGVFGQLLAAHVDTSSDTWRWLLPGAEPPAQELERFRAASRIRDVFFAHGGRRPAFQLTFRPVDMDDGLDRFELEIDGQTVRYAHGPPVPTVIKWPGTQGSARIEVSPASADPPLAYSGPWALFRLLDHAAVRETGAPGHFQVVFDVGGRHTTFEVTSDNGTNPFRMRELERFECPISGQ